MDKADLHVLGASSGFYTRRVAFHLTQTRERTGTYYVDRGSILRNISLANGRMGRTEEESPKFVTADDALSHVEHTRAEIGKSQVKAGLWDLQRRV